ncbi:hypothetical protein D3C72_2587810 [compost metagenome]
MTKKPAPPKKMSEEMQRAQGRLDSACVRGETQDVIDDLRARRDAIVAKEKK